MSCTHGPALGSLGIKERIQALDQRSLAGRLEHAERLLAERRSELAAKCAIREALGGVAVKPPRRRGRGDGDCKL